MRILAAILLNLLLVSSAFAQSQLAPGQVWGNPKAVKAPPSAATVQSPLILDGGGLRCPTCSGVVAGQALTSTNDTNITLTLGGSPNIALINPASLTLGWTGTLDATRLNSNVVQSVVNDTNITASISAQALTFGWAGTLAATRLNPNVVQAITNDTNITGSISAQNLTLGWAGVLSVARGGTGVSSFGTGVATALGIATNASGGFVTSPVANANLATMAALTVKANATNSIAAPTDVATTSGSNFPLRENGGGALSFGPLNGGFALNANSTPLNKLANGTANTIIGALTAAAHTDLAVPSCSSASQALQWVSGTGLQCATFGALVNVTPGTGVATALGVNVGTAGSFVVNGGSLGTPTSGTLTNATGLVASTGINATGTPSSTTFLRGDNTWSTPAGGGNVSNTGTPTSGQFALWTSSTVVQGVSAASKTDQQTATSTTNAVTPSQQQSHPSSPKAWAYYTGVGGSYVQQSAYNVASITKNSTGNINVTLTTPFAAATYAVVVASDSQTFVATAFPVSASVIGIRITNLSGTASDAGFSFSAFGAQ